MVTLLQRFFAQVYSKFRTLLAKYENFLGEQPVEQITQMKTLQDLITRCRATKLECNIGRTLSKKLEAWGA